MENSKQNLVQSQQECCSPKQNEPKQNEHTSDLAAHVAPASAQPAFGRVAPVRVAVTGAAGRIGYSLLFRIASGAIFGSEQPVILQLLEISSAMGALKGVAMELEDCAFDLLAGVVCSDDPYEAFADADVAILVGARPRTKGMERKDLLAANGAIFTNQGHALSESAKPDVKVVVVGNPANTNCFVAMNNAPSIPRKNFTAMTRLDHNRAKAQLANKLNLPVADITKMTIWGNHSITQYPDISQCCDSQDKGQIAQASLDQNWIDRNWIVNDFIPTVQKRGAAIIDACGVSSAASAANAVVDHMRDWISGTPVGDWVSMAVPSDGSYGVPEGLVSSFPVTCADSEYSIVHGIELDGFSRERIDISIAELIAERDAVIAAGLV